MKKVTGERLIAAIIDSIIVSIVSGLPVIIYLMSGGLDSLVSYYMGSQAVGANPLEIGGSYITFLAITTYFALAIGIVYFVYMPYKMNGQTLGKKVMKIKAIDEFGENPTFKQHFIRAIQNWGTYATAITFFIILVSETAYNIFGTMVSSIVGIIAFVSYIMILASQDGRGLHDNFAGTRVVKDDIDFNKEFVEKTTQMGKWAEVVDPDEESDNGISKEEDPWKY